MWKKTSFIPVTFLALQVANASDSSNSPFETAPGVVECQNTPCGEALDQFSIVCREGDRVSTHWEYKDGEYTYFTVNESTDSENVIFSARPSRVEVSYRSNPSIPDDKEKSWARITIGTKGAEAIDDNAMGQPDLMTIRIRSSIDSPEDRWSEINILKQEAFIGPDGYLSSVFKNEKNRDGCSADF
ncbi:hypothetical protein [Spiribacter vilamensis]|uniref:hypothetical protein n=1 Tax=Spiribacter vilamensis TaxID=531306 RepID=UPI00102BC368|nr:hypothetical protein [Spiribacter vilamensis]TVO62204.1 hypothetical protein FPL09_09025 [Spiribacter vilamensis]